MQVAGIPQPSAEMVEAESFGHPGRTLNKRFFDHKGCKLRRTTLHQIFSWNWGF